MSHQDKNDFLNTTEKISLKKYILAIIDERNKRYENRFDAIEKTLVDFLNENKSLSLLISTSKADVVLIINDRLNNINNQIINLQNTFARKEDIINIMSSSEKAILKAETATERRFDSVNEFRQTLSDQQNNFARKEEIDVRFKSLEDKMNTALASQQNQKGWFSGVGSLWVFIVGLFGIIAVILALWTSNNNSFTTHQAQNGSRQTALP
ncbi:MAG: hypothetical protein AABY22_35075 [Nanoarchaeota archaeon]